jgi:hypothetical protein
MQKTKTAKKEQDDRSYRELPVFQDRRINSVKRNFAIGIDRVGTSISLSSAPSQDRKGLNRN